MLQTASLTSPLRFTNFIEFLISVIGFRPRNMSPSYIYVTKAKVREFLQPEAPLNKRCRKLAGIESVAQFTGNKRMKTMQVAHTPPATYLCFIVLVTRWTNLGRYLLIQRKELAAYLHFIGRNCVGGFTRLNERILGCNYLESLKFSLPRK